MDFKDIDQIKKAGFSGFIKMSDLLRSNAIIPDIRGVYFVLYLSSNKPNFLKIGTGGHFKGKNPNVSIEELNQNWVPDATVVYMGKAGGEDSNATLRSRLNQYLKFGQGKNIGHYGGRLIWQIEKSEELVICWKPLPNDNPRKIESEFIQDFISIYGQRPFANLTD